MLPCGMHPTRNINWQDKPNPGNMPRAASFWEDRHLAQHEMMMYNNINVNLLLYFSFPVPKWKKKKICFKTKNQKKYACLGSLILSE